MAIDALDAIAIRVDTTPRGGEGIGTERGNLVFGELIHAVGSFVHSMGSLGMASTGAAAAIGQLVLGRRLRHALCTALDTVSPPERPSVHFAEPHARVAVID